ncbi:putative secreted peptidase [Candidatus Protochlamydia naegleriophila]|uniref:Protein TolB homolog n=1 Tax=Candidatus Protochlamydia naegleriophila TaxID=389348 RepID=A0A0U5ESZ6_9BACT|nr:S9 family peptidase [Candidatus Protochlamydia naegleriophila]CUI17376.1 putative secreted peptidase [Candidatus Protochlamydia naegleriophila]
MFFSRSIFKIIVFPLLALALLNGELTARWTPVDMMHLKMIREVQLSPDKQTALVVVSEASINAEQDAYVSRIYQINVNNRKAEALTAPNCQSMQPRWSPDGSSIAYLSDYSGIKTLYLLRRPHAFALALDLKKDIQTFRWSPDGRYIAFVATDKKNVQTPPPKSSAFDYEEDLAVNRLWIIDLLSERPISKALTNDTYSVRGCGDFGTINEEFDWSPDSRSIIFAYSPSCKFDDFYVESHLARVDVVTQAVTQLKKHARHESLPRFSPDGKWIALLASEPGHLYAFNRYAAIRSADDQEERRLAPTTNEGPFLAGPNLLGWSLDCQSIWLIEPVGTSFQLVRLGIDGKQVDSLSSDLMIKDPSLSSDGKTIAFTGQTTNKPPEAYIATLPKLQPVQLSQFNQPFLNYPSIHTESIHWQSNDGKSIEGLLTYPSNYQKGKRYPLLLVVHGGPMAFFDQTYLGMPYPYPLASLAEAGFIILRPNPRGSCGYGKAFRCLNYGDWGGKDFEDLMTGVDAVIERGMGDPERLGIMGWSYGGYMTAWAITQTNRFKAASIGAGLSNLASMSGTTDLHRFLQDYLGPFWEQPALYQQRSPIYHVKKVETPCLIQHGLSDRRVPVAQAIEYYHALKTEHKPSKLILYPRMGHHFTEPSQQIDLMERNLEWFTSHLLN